MTDFAGNMRCDAKPPILNYPHAIQSFRADLTEQHAVVSEY